MKIIGKFFEYLNYHPISGTLFMLFFVGYILAFILAFSLNMPYAVNFYQIIIPLFFWLPYIPIALKTRNKYAVYGAIAPFAVFAFFIIIFLIIDIFFAVTGININPMHIAKEQPVILAIIILTIIFGFFGLLIYLAIKYQKSNLWIHSLWMQKGGVLCDTASKIYSTTDGYSERPYLHGEKINNLNFSDIGDFAKLLAKNLIIINWKHRENSVKMWLLVRKNFIEYLDLFYSENLGSWIEINRDGKVIVFIAKQDYKNIYREVTYHTLCQTIAGKFEESFVEFAKGGENNKMNSIKILRGDGK